MSKTIKDKGDWDAILKFTGKKRARNIKTLQERLTHAISIYDKNAKIKISGNSIYLRGNFPDNFLEGFKGGSNIPFNITHIKEDRAHQAEYVTLLEEENTQYKKEIENLKQEAEKHKISFSGLEKISLDRDKYLSKVTEFTDKNRKEKKELITQLEDTTKKYKLTLEENLKLTEKLKEAHEELSDGRTEFLEYAEKVNNEMLPKNAREVAIYYIQDSISRFADLEMKADGSLLSYKVSAKDLIKRFNSLGVHKVRSVKEIINLINTENINEVIGNTFDEQNNSEYKQYENAKKDLKQLREHLNVISRDPKVPVGFMEKQLALAKSEIKDREEIIEEYKKKKDEAVREKSRGLSKIADLIDNSRDQEKIRLEIEKGQQKPKFPAYIEIKESERDYEFYLLLTLGENAKSVLWNIFNDFDVNTAIKKDSLRVKEPALVDSKTNLHYNHIVLDKEQCNLDDVNKLRSALEKAVKKFYDSTDLSRIGIELEIITNYNIEIPEKVITDQIEVQHRTGGYSKEYKENQTLNILHKAEGNLSNEQIREQLELLGIKVSNQVVWSTLNNLREEGKVEKFGKARYTLYSVKR